jgi:hypothetical protein
MTRLALTGGRGLSLAEKWYVDTLLDDGGVLIVYLFWMRNAGIASAEVRAELHTAEGSVHRGRARAARIRGGEDELLFGPARIAGTLFAWETPGLSGVLTMKPRRDAAVLCDPVFLDGRQTIRWTVEVPDADVEGRLFLPGGARAIKGRGYRDRVYCNVIPWRFPLRTLTWGRAVAGAHASIWFRAEMGRGEACARWEDGCVRREPPAVPETRASRLLLDERLAERVCRGAPPLRPVARWLLSDPHQRRWTAAATLGGQGGRALYEEVHWR